jgi:DNA-binding LacI/PurR family transcriptional regulator
MAALGIGAAADRLEQPTDAQGVTMPTIQDVAREAGVSAATVSRVINHPDIVVAEKRERVREAIARLGFEPSAPARYLRMGASNAIALLVGDISQPFHGSLAKAVEAAAEEMDLSVMLGDLDHREDRLVSFLRSARKRGVAGVILATADDLNLPTVKALIDEVTASGIPVVTTTQRVDLEAVPAVTSDYTAVGHDAVEHLAAQGRRHLVMLGGGTQSWYSRELETGMRSAAQQHGISMTVLDGGFRHEPARSAIAALAGSGHLPDGIISANTPMALGALRALQDLGLEVPKDASLVVCEDVPDNPYLVPSLTSVDADLDSLGRTAVDLLARLLHGEDAPATTKLPHRLVIRESSLPTSAAANHGLAS